ncbi:MAG: LytTR family DNA-binding domain-containing protein [Ignavibacteria bacterium]
MKKKILVIEDEEEIRDNIRLLLEAEEYKVELAPNGKEGIKKIEEWKPDLVLCDIIMPEADGYQVIKNLKVKIPFIFLTAKVGYKDFRKGMCLGADDYLIKPFHIDELLTAIETRLSKYESITNTQYSPESRIFFKIRNRSIPVQVEKIMYISAERQYSSIFVEGDKQFFIKKALNKWEKILPSGMFIRIHRSTLVNINYIKKMQRGPGTSYQIYLCKSDTVLTVSRRFYKKFKDVNYEFLMI